MGRGKAPKPPSYTTNEIRYGDKVIGKTYRDPITGNLVSQYLPDPAEEQKRQIIQQKMNEIMSSMGKTPVEISAQYDDTEKAFIDDAKSKFLEQYNPALRELRNDVASRFGSLNSSQFLSGLNDLEKNKASAFVDIINRGKMLKTDLVNNDEAKKLQALQALGGILNMEQDNITNNLNSQADTSAYLNDFLNSKWLSMLRDYRQEKREKRGLLF